MRLTDFYPNINLNQTFFVILVKKSEVMAHKQESKICKMSFFMRKDEVQRLELLSGP